MSIELKLFISTAFIFINIGMAIWNYYLTNYKTAIFSGAVAGYFTNITLELLL